MDKEKLLTVIENTIEILCVKNGDKTK